MEYLIRNETPEDWLEVEAMTREAFWNIYEPGCAEHYLVHEMRKHRDFIPELDFVIEHDGEIVGNIMYTKARLVNSENEELRILTFGPLCIKKAYQRRGLGKKLMEHSFQKARALGYSIIVIFGNPGNYVTSGFRSCQRYSISIGEGTYPTAMLVKELADASLPGGKWRYVQSDVYDLDMDEAEKYDATLPKLEKRTLPGQEEFYILSHSSIGNSCI